MTPTWTCGKCLVKYRVGDPSDTADLEVLRCPSCNLRFSTNTGPRVYIAEKDLPAGACVMEGAAE